MSIVSRPLADPNFCFICKHSNDVEYWDSHRYFDPPYPIPESGRKYVCFDCIKTAAKEFGFLDPKDAAELLEKVDFLEKENEFLNHNLNLVKTIEDAAKTIAEGYPGQAKKKKPAKQESKANKKAVEDSVIISTSDADAS